MALPKLNTPTYELELPSTAEILKYRPFLVKEQKLLLIAQESGEDTQIANAMGELVKTCTFNKIDPKITPMFDLEYIFLKIRGKSVGEKVELNLLCPDDGKTTVKKTININDIEVQMDETHTNKIKITDDIELEFRYPVLDDMIELETHESEIEKTFFFLKSCIQSITFGDDIHHRVDLKDKEIIDFIDSMTGDQFETLTEFFNTMPKLRHIINVTNPKTKKKNEILLEGLESFLG